MSDEELQENLHTAFYLMEMGVLLMQQRLRRERPDDSEEAVAARLAAWLRTPSNREQPDDGAA